MNPKISIFLLLLLYLTKPALSKKCQTNDRLPSTCSCFDESTQEYSQVKLLCVDSTLLQLENALSLMDKSNRLDVVLISLKLEDLPSKIFYGLNVIKLSIYSSNLNGLAPPGEIALQGLEETLLVLEIDSSFTENEKTTVLPPLSHLTRLVELELSDNVINELTDNWFSSPPPALTHIILSNNGIQKLGDRAFEKLVNLEYFALNGNRFGSIKRSMLPKHGDKLEYLRLENNALTSVPDDLFTNMPGLRILSIKNNGIAHLQESAFKSIFSQLDIFNARDNPLECDSTMEWLFDVGPKGTLSTYRHVFGTCAGPLGKEGTELEDFIQNRGQ